MVCLPLAAAARCCLAASAAATARVGCADMSLREQGVVGDMGLRLQGVFRRKGKPLHESQCNGSTHLTKGAVCLRGHDGSRRPLGHDLLFRIFGSILIGLINFILIAIFRNPCACKVCERLRPCVKERLRACVCV